MTDHAGLLFTKVDLDTFPRVLEGAVSVMYQVLTKHSTVKAMVLSAKGEHRREHVVMQLAALVMMTVHNATAPTEHRPG